MAIEFGDYHQRNEIQQSEPIQEVNLTYNPIYSYTLMIVLLIGLFVFIMAIVNPLAYESDWEHWHTALFIFFITTLAYLGIFHATRFVKIQYAKMEEQIRRKVELEARQKQNEEGQLATVMTALVKQVDLMQNELLSNKANYEEVRQEIEKERTRSQNLEQEKQQLLERIKLNGNV